MKYFDVVDPLRKVIEITGGKWRLLILHELRGGVKRFKHLEENITGITPRMLTKELRALKNFGLVEKEVYKTLPPRVDYCLSTYGESVLPIIDALHAWGEKHLEIEGTDISSITSITTTIKPILEKPIKVEVKKEPKPKKETVKKVVIESNPEEEIQQLSLF